MVVEARSLSKELKKNDNGDGNAELIRALDALGYDEAAEHVYGMEYAEWKKRHAKKASDEVMEKFNASKPLWAKHDKELLATRAPKPETPVAPTDAKPTLLSNVCCQDPEEAASAPLSVGNATNKEARAVTPKVPDPPAGTTKFSLSILTISDRASSGEYETGDLSGPAVTNAVTNVVKEMMRRQPSSNGDSKVEFKVSKTAIATDDVDSIQGKLKEWSSGDEAVDLILTTGGTGFSKRDVTPEATRGILSSECHGLMSYIASECSKLQPLAALSRGTAGIVKKTFIANLPGNPNGVDEIIPLLLPLALHAIVDMRASDSR
jgi:gephyrin